MNIYIIVRDILIIGKPSYIPYKNILNGNIKQKKHVIQILDGNMKYFQKLTLARNIPWADSYFIVIVLMFNIYILLALLVPTVYYI